MSSKVDKKSEEFLKIVSFNWGKNIVKIRDGTAGVLAENLHQFAMDLHILLIVEQSHEMVIKEAFKDKGLYWIRKNIRKNEKDFIMIGINTKKLKILKEPSKINGQGYYSMELQFGSTPFIAVFCHLKWKKNREESRLKLMEKFAKNENVIVLGDLNMEPDDIRKHPKFNKELHHMVFNESDSPTTIKNGRKDNVLVHKRFIDIQKVEKLVSQKVCSDHFAIQTMLQFNQHKDSSTMLQVSSKKSIKENTRNDSSKGLIECVLGKNTDRN